MVSKRLFFFLALFLLLLDQFFKFLVLSGVSFSSSFFSFHFVPNSGVSFGLFQGSNSLFVWFSLMVVGACLFWFFSFDESFQPLVFLFLAGVLSNLFDRIFRGFVVDYFDLGWWPVFNLADSLIVVSVLLALFLIFSGSELVKV